MSAAPTGTRNWEVIPARTLNVHFHSLYLDGVYVTRGAFDPPVFVPAGRLTSDEVKRVHADVIVRIRRVLERYDLDPIALGLPLRRGDEAPCEFADSSGSEHPLLDFGDARDGSFFPDLKVEELLELYEARPTTEIEWIAAHSGNRGRPMPAPQCLRLSREQELL